MRSHSKQRAEERFFINDFCAGKALSEIYADKCIQLNESYEKFSRIFLIRYCNKYVRVVTDYNVGFVKTVLPLKNDFDLINKLIEKISACEAVAA